MALRDRPQKDGLEKLYFFSVILYHILLSIILETDQLDNNSRFSYLGDKITKINTLLIWPGPHGRDKGQRNRGRQSVGARVG